MPRFGSDLLDTFDVHGDRFPGTATTMVGNLGSERRLNMDISWDGDDVGRPGWSILNCKSAISRAR